MAAMANPKIVANGINGATGQYDRAPIEIGDLARALRGQDPQSVAAGHVSERGRRLSQPAFTRALPWGIEPSDIARAGWGVVFHKDETQAVRDAIKPLIAHRRAQVGVDARVHELTYHPGESATAWLGRHDVAWHNITPTKIPYYLLWVGSPERMPFEVIREIDSDYCVGLLDLETPNDYTRYVNSVIAYETAPIANGREAVFFGTRHPFDDATMLSADWLISPLTDGVAASGTTPADPAVAPQLGFRQRKIVAEGATRQALIDVFTASGPAPSLLFTASHGMVWPNGDARQFAAQGALLCQDWPGFGAMTNAHYLSAADIPDTARLAGMVTFHFACYGAGTPGTDEYAFTRDVAPPPIAPRPFTAALPRKLLAHPAGGALACIGHVERAWGYSITGGVQSPQIRAFQKALAQILVGKPVGLAVQEFNDLCATLSNVLTRLLGNIHHGTAVDDVELVSTWTHRNDAAGFVLLGDPAVRLRVNDLV
jgi:hypothetical protein